MNPLTWTEPEQSGASKCALSVARCSVDDGEMRVTYTRATPSDVAAALNAIDEEMAREVFSHPAAMRAGSWIRKMADARHDLAAALKRAEAAELAASAAARERDHEHLDLVTTSAERDTERGIRRTLTWLLRDPSNIRATMDAAVRAFGCGDNRFNASGFSNQAAALSGNLGAILDGDWVRGILHGHAVTVPPGDAHFRPLDWTHKTADDLFAARKRAEAAEKELQATRERLYGAAEFCADGWLPDVVRKLRSLWMAEQQRSTVAERERDEARSKLADMTSRAETAEARSVFFDERLTRWQGVLDAASRLAQDRRLSTAQSVIDAVLRVPAATTPAHPATPALSPDDAAELEALRALMRWTRASDYRWVAATEAEWISRDTILGAVHDDVVGYAPTPQAPAAKLGAK